ncbi:MAG: hypothetical protein KIT72_16375 [Polyangiaceae bacterium]|nr:hypothetical protein [Polyangiaceae bacterium]MCW5791994.1 hypothetical protein [Polyangiaceae bacterium]
MLGAGLDASLIGHEAHHLTLTLPRLRDIRPKACTRALRHTTAGTP